MSADAARCHFTYTEPKGDLCQGDVLARSEEVSAILKTVHPHYLKDDYTHFLVTTQSCDLVRRDGDPCKARYITIAAVRPLTIVAEREIARHQERFDKALQVCSLKKRDKVEQFIERIFNNNDPEYFYLEPEAAFGLSEPSCAFLRLSIALRAQEHYAKLLTARRLSLTDIFQAKLGWLIGSMYSRVGTPDWVPDVVKAPAFREKINDVVRDAVTWVDPEQLKVARSAAANETEPEKLREVFENAKVPRKKQQVLDAIVNVLRAQGENDEEKLRVIRQRLENDPALTALVK